MRDEVIERMCEASNIPPRSEDGWWTNRTGMTAALRVAIDAARRELERNKTDQSDVQVPEDLFEDWDMALAGFAFCGYQFLKFMKSIARAEAALGQWKTWGIVEVAIRNPNVASYMEHWEGRATKAEAENAQLRQQIEGLSRPVSDEEWKAIPKLMSSLTGRRSYSSRDEVDALLAARAGGKNNEK